MTIRHHLGGISLALAVGLAAPLTLSAQGIRGGTIFTGTVTDTTGQPLVSAIVSISNTSLASETDIWGDFSIQGVPLGTYLITVSSPGFESRTFRFTLTPDHPRLIHLGALPLMPATTAPPMERVITLFGTVTQPITDEPIPGTLISIDGVIEAVTGPEGTYRIDGLGPGQHLFQTRRLGFRPTSFTITLGDDDRAAVDVSLALEPIPIELEEVVVEADRTIIGLGKMREFYRRREQAAGGSFITRGDIERQAPNQISEVFQDIPGVMVSGRQGPGRVTIRTCGRPNVYLDGVRINNLADVSIDDLVVPEQVEAIEVYRGAFVPTEFRTDQRGTCGVIAIWTRF